MPVRIEVLAMEVVQSIQNLKGDIPLLANKGTAVRVYLRPSGLSSNMPVGATLAVTRDGRREEIESAASVVLRRDGDHPDLEAQRRSLDQSLCFLLDGRHVRPGRVELTLARVTPRLRGDLTRGPELAPHEPTRADFTPGPTLSVRAISLRVRDPETGELHAPTASHRYALRSYLERAFPVSQVRWSEITIDAAAAFTPPYSDPASTLADPGRVWQEKFDTACAHLMAIRARELEAGQDPSTRYYGVVHHPTDFFIGAVSDVPSTVRPDIVGIGPADAGDGSYGAHELAHMLGRLHPGYCCGQSREDREFPEGYRGRLSSERDGHHGFDVGDATQRPRVLPFDTWFDLMTYCEPLWVSAYTYTGLLDHLREQQEFRPVVKVGARTSLHVIGTYGLAGHAQDPSGSTGEPRGTLAYLFPGKLEAAASREATDLVALVGRDRNGDQLFKTSVELKLTAAKDLPRDSGAFHVALDHNERLSRLELWVEDTLVASLASTDMTRTTEEEHVEVGILSPQLKGDSYMLAIAWPNDYGTDRSHTVQARWTRDDYRWVTIAAGITAETTEVFLDCEEPAETLCVDVRILRARGFSEDEIYHDRPRIH